MLITRRPRLKALKPTVSVNVFHRTIQEEFYAIAFRKKIYRSIEELQLDLNSWLSYYNNERTHIGKHCYGKTPMQTFLDSKTMAKEKLSEVLQRNKKFLLWK